MPHAPASEIMRRASRLLLVGFACLASGCVYFNGVYNATAAARSGDARLRRGAESDAAAFFQTSAAKAETVLVRHPTSKWRTRALYLAGRGAALGGQCEQAVPHLNGFLSGASADVEDRARARVALASCELRLSRVADARARLDSLTDFGNPVVARQARLWAARAALAAGDRDAVTGYLRDADDNALPWELIAASLSAREYVRVESLLVQRAARADYRDDVVRAVRELWDAGEFAAAEAIVRAYEVARVRDAARAALHFTIGDLHLRAGNEGPARQHLFAARTLAGRDTVTAREANARLGYLLLPRVVTLREIDTLVARQDSSGQRSPYAQRMTERILLLRLLERTDDATGASVYLAAEVARDSLRAPLLAKSLFLRVAREMPGAPFAAQAWYAASLLSPDSADAWRAHIRRAYVSSATAAWLRGEDPSTRPDYAMTPELLTVRWNDALRTWSDSVRRLRTVPSAAKPSTGRK